MRPGYIAVSIAGHRGSIVGTVTDPSTGLVVVGATVALSGAPLLTGPFASHLETRAQTRHDGSYCFIDLPDGSYTLTVTVPAGGYLNPAATGSATVSRSGKPAVANFAAIAGPT